MTTNESIQSLEQKVDQLTEQVAFLVERQHKQQELVEEFGPILKEMMGVGTAKMGELEKRGYFEFAVETARVLDTVVTSYGADDVRQLGDNVVRILDTVKRVTQPDVLAIAADASQAIHESDDVEPKGIFGMMRESRDDDVRRGMAMMIEVLRYVGRGAARMTEGRLHTDATALVPASKKHRALADMLAPKSRPPDAQPARPAQPVGPQATAPPVPTAPVVDGETCVFINDGEWNRDYAASVAARLGIAEFTDAHWQVVSFARDDFKETGSSPNIRRITKGLGVSTRDIYGLFPNKPGIATAMCAGIPKPGGCI